MRKVSRSALCALLATALVGGCDGPFSLTLNHVNEKGPQRNAVIAISDPQIYTRERLLNDRDDEVEFLRQQMDDVNNQDFTPRLKRDLDMLLEIVASISAKFDPVAGASIVQQAQIAGLENEAQIKQLEARIDELEKNPKPSDPKEGAQSANSGDLAPISTKDLTTDMRAFLSELTNAIKARNTDPNTTKPTLRDNKVSDATPSEVFRDKIAYRNEILAALQQAQLDDRHDLDGNALYRLQIKATVFPGKIKDKYALTRMTILPPVFEDSNSISRLYLEWLAHVARQLNPVQDAKGVTVGDAEIASRYAMFGAATGTFRTSYLPYKKREKADCSIESAAKASSEDAEKASSEDAATAGSGDAAKAGSEDSANKGSDLLRDCFVVSVPTPPEFDQNDVMQLANPQSAKRLIAFLNAAAKAFEAARNVDLTDDDPRRCTKVSVGEESLTKSDAEMFDAVEAGSKSTAEPPADRKEIAPPTAKQLAAAFVYARNIYNLAPTYFLAIERTRQNFARSANASPDVVAAMQSYAVTLSSAKDASYEVLVAFRDALAKSDDDRAAKAQVEALKKGDQVTRAEPQNQDEKAAGKSGVPCRSFEEVAGRIWVPEAFYTAVADRTGVHSNGPDVSGRIREKPIFTAGSAYAYSTAPTELAQRVSTVASATEAMDLIASVQALIPSASVGINAAGEMRQIASGTVHAIESVPLIVGFSNSGVANKVMGQNLASEVEPSFGWVFGPKVTVDAKDSELELSQVLVDQPVTADVSVPGWWTEMRLRVETAWTAGFDKAMLQSLDKSGNAPKPEAVTSYEVKVPLQGNPESFEQLTQFLANKTWGLQQRQPVITDIEPRTLSACSEATVLIGGPDLWRGRAVYLNGIAAKRTKVMPDMRGLAATFDLPAMEVADATLVVWTQLGKVEAPIRIGSSANCGSGPGASPGLRGQVTSQIPVLWQTGSVDLQAAAPWPGNGIFTARLYPKGQGENADLRTDIEAKDLLPNDRKLTLTLSKAAAGNPSPDGAPMEGQVFMKSGAETGKVATFGPIYLYSSKAKASIAVTTTKDTVKQADLKAGVPFKATFPTAFAAAYQNLINQKLRMVVAAENGEIIDEVSGFDFPLDDASSRDVPFTVQLTSPQISALGAEQRSLTIKVVVGSGKDAPDFVNLTPKTITVTKPTP
ncbi:hypothetical protein [Dongia sedimenti]|uniref:Uncharacterized protein n=1 Tax=Dongia sedimenti TaxID=3064282 RepID=A0ABU0YMK4_9PROT|nr:hypothetical protein [Rhodospirillaceae bacterium R-7]